MNAAQRSDLHDLRRAATARDHEQSQFLLKRLLLSMDYYAALAIVAGRLWAWLEIFESYYPDEAWVRRLLLSIVNYGSPPDDSIAEAALSQPFSEPGAGNYIKAVYDLTQAMQPKHGGEVRAGFMTSALVNAITAEVAEAWYGEHEDAWQQVRANQIDPISGAWSDPEAQQIALAFWLDEQTVALETACWREVADAIEAALRRAEARG